MIGKLRWKFVALNMIFVTLILTVTGIFLLSSFRDELRSESISLLQRVMDNDLNETPGIQFSQGGITILPPASSPEEISNTQTPYFTVHVTSHGVVTLSENRYFDTVDEDFLLAIVGATLEAPGDSGVLDRYDLRFLRVASPFGWRIAYVDTLREENTFEGLVSNLILIFALALLVFFGISVAFSHWAVAPVARSWQQQRQFVSDASHELKTPLAVVMSNLDMLERYGNEDPEKQERWLDNIRSSSSQMKTLVEEMLVLARSEDTSPSRMFEQVDLSDLTEAALLLFEPAAFESGKTIREDIQQGLFLPGDREKLTRLLGILLDNAVKYAQTPSRIDVTLKGEGKRILLSVFSRGEPIPRDQLEKVFQRFYRLDPARTQGGYGLGLSIARQIAEEHKGKLWAQSDVSGNTFYCSLPRGK